MSTLSMPQVYSIVAQALDYLDAKGRRLAVDELLRLFTFLEQLQAGQIDQQHLARYITPLLANTPEEQLGISQCVLNAVLLDEIGYESDAPPILDHPVEDPDTEGPSKRLPEADGTSTKRTDKEDEAIDTNTDPPKTTPIGTPNPPIKKDTGTYVAEVQKFDKAPYVWQVDLGAEHLIAEPRNIRVLVNQLQERQLLDAHELDIERTVKGMATSPGVFRPRYRQLTQAPSYLLLIDERARNDHRARIFDMLYGYLRFNDIEVQRFFFDADPRTCFNDNHPHGISLATLYQYHRSARLLLLSYGYELFSPSTGEWSPWTRTFLQWQERALLSPMPTQNWGGMGK